MKSIGRTSVAVAGLALLSGCGMMGGARSSAPITSPATADDTLVPDTPVTIGKPYKVGDTTYTPADISDYDEVGYATVYGEGTGDKATANGERFDPAAIAAAHKTLPLPSYVEVTALDTGRTILVRVNDRGPMATDRLIDLTPAAAAQLGLKGGATGVRVRRVHPPAAERAQLRAGDPVPERLPTPDSLLAILRSKLSGLPSPAAIAAGVAKPAPATAKPATPDAPPAKTAEAPASPVKSAPPPERIKPGSDRFVVEGEKAPPTASAAPKPTAAAPAATAPASGRYTVQVAMFGNKANAAETARALGGSVAQAGKYWRVTMGPFASQADAQAALAKAKAGGFRDALVRNRP